ncbi:MAG: sigma-54-dependent Fis family transcriptional regulator, partial [Deltaproteobacteria bacterium]|nr:sigma-54-dependent Fis family transcriptional regulator [Deltaproteobacteria bacterium]
MELILLIDDDKSLLRVTEYNLKTAGFDVVTAESGTTGLEKFRSVSPALIITDVKLSDINGLELLKAVKEESPDTPVIVMTAFGSIEMAVKAMKRGAFNFITKPFDRDTLRLSCKKALELASLRNQNRLLSEEVNRLAGTDGMETANPAMKELMNTALAVADSEATVLITGESGTGKEVLARMIHQKSGRSKNSMVAVNCAAIPEALIESELFGHVKGAFTGATSNRKGKFLASHGGTLFLDEISELKTDMQAKLLRVIQEREVEPVGSEKREKIDIRIIAASNKDLAELTGKGEFREDLYYRLSVIPLHLPPLRERREDVIILVRHLLKKLRAPADVKFSKEAIKALEEYSWPGNIRELQNTVERCLILRKGSTIEKNDLNLIGYGTFSAPVVDIDIPDEGISLEEVEKSLIEKALKKSNGNRSEAARILRIPRHVLIYRL